MERKGKKKGKTVLKKYDCTPIVPAYSALPQLSRNVEVDDAKDIITIYGIKYAGGLFRGLGIETPMGQFFKILSRDDGVITIQSAPDGPTTQDR